MLFAVGRGEHKRTLSIPAGESMMHMETHALRAQASHPAAQERCGFQVGREDATGGADEGLDAQSACKFAQVVGIEHVEPAAQFGLTTAITRHEGLEVIAVRQVQTALAGNQELAPDRTHRVEHIDRDTGRTRRLRRHQPGGTAADDGELAGR